MRRLQFLIGAIVFVDVAFYAAVVPLLPELSEELNVGKSGAGVLMGAYAVGTVLGSLPAGWLISRLGVKPTVLTGLSLMTLAGLAFTFGDSIVVLDVGRFLQGLGAACSWAAGLAWLVAATPRERRGAVLGAALGVGIFGAQFGPVIGGVASEIGRELTFSVTVALGAALLAWAWATPAPALPEQAAMSPARALRDGGIRMGMLFSLLPGLGVGVVDVLLPLRLDVLGASALAISVVFFFAAIASGSTGPVFGRINDRRGTMPVARFALIGGALGLVALQLPDTAWLLGVAGVIALGLNAILWVPGIALLAGGAERLSLDQGYAFAFFNLAWSSGMAIGSTAGGALAEATADEVPYLLVAGAFAVTAIAVLARHRGAREPAGGVPSGSSPA